ncbi:MAG TPA: MaoC family dehydratase [Sporichthyaceae bacterium]|nr:MaoC family dehydratase [Sporichthyaceae bacterium]
MRVFENLEEFAKAAGSELGTSDWLTVDQKRIDEFAEATGDHQWIHVDPERAAAGPFGTTIAHGLLTLSLYAGLIQQIYRVDGIRMGINYGLNKVRFPSPVRVGSQIRVALSLAEVTAVDGGVQVVLAGKAEIKDAPKPACVFEAVARYYG